jgi:hypothetical protein
MKVIAISFMFLFAQMAQATFQCQVLDRTSGWEQASVRFVGYEENEEGYVLELISNLGPSENKSYVAFYADDINYPGYCAVDARVCISWFVYPNEKNVYEGELTIGGDPIKRLELECVDQ